MVADRKDATPTELRHSGQLQRGGIFVVRTRQTDSSSVRSGICRPDGAGELLAWVSTKISLLTELREDKRWRATALQDARAFCEDARIARSVLECASPLAL